MAFSALIVCVWKGLYVSYKDTSHVPLGWGVRGTSNRGELLEDPGLAGEIESIS